MLERLPAKLNERPPAFCGRDELETLMASPSANDWVELTSRLLGTPTPTRRGLSRSPSPSCIQTDQHTLLYVRSLTLVLALALPTHAHARLRSRSLSP